MIHAGQKSVDLILTLRDLKKIQSPVVLSICHWKIGFTKNPPTILLNDLIIIMKGKRQSSLSNKICSWWNKIITVIWYWHFDGSLTISIDDYSVDFDLLVACSHVERNFEFRCTSNDQRIITLEIQCTCMRYSIRWNGFYSKTYRWVYSAERRDRYLE